MLTFQSKASRILSRTLCVVLANGCVPFGLAVLVKDPFAKPATPEYHAPKRHAPRSMPLTAKQQRTFQGKTGQDPYVAGANKWDPVYRGVDLVTWNYTMSATDLDFEGGYGIPVNVTRSYSANCADEGPFGIGWTLSADVRSTAGGLLKGPGAPSASVPTDIQEKPAAEVDPLSTGGAGAPTGSTPVSAVTSTDASGQNETIEKDVDGVLTTPPWDNNTHNATYEVVTSGGYVYSVLLSNTVTTADGTVYAYAKEGSYSGGQTPFNDPYATATPANILKVTSAVDRQGNTTTYSYGSTPVTFQKADGYTSENPLTSVHMPNAHTITFTWGDGTSAPTNRIVSASDGCGRTVTYGYTNGYMVGTSIYTGWDLTSVTSPAGKVTTYGYTTPLEFSADATNGVPDATNILGTITDPRGMTTTIGYVMNANSYITGYGSVPVPQVMVYKVLCPNGVDMFQTELSPIDATELADGCYDGGTWQGSFTENIGSAEGAVINYGRVATSVNPETATVTVAMTGTPMTATSADTLSTSWVKTYEYSTQDLLDDQEYTVPSDSGSLASARLLPTQGYKLQTVETASGYNFQGNPLSQVVTESQTNTDGTVTTVRTAETDTAYWGVSKYYQKKATKDPAGRFSYTDYYPSTASAGSKGQTYQVYSPAFTTFTNGDGGAPDSDWPDDLTPASATYSAQFGYDSKGRATDVYKLQSATTTPWTYVQTHTTYGSDTDGSWGEASEVVEDYGGIGRTTQTNGYTSDGKADDVIDAAGHEFVTSYDADGVVQSVTRTDGGSTTLVSYTYGTSGLTNGMPTAITDGLSGVTQSISYDSASDGGYGQVSSVTETNGSDSYTDSYTYWPSGDRATAVYTTPATTMRWGYGDYVPVGTPEGGKRAFQTLSLLDSSSNPTGEEMHYAFDSAGRIGGAAFAQTPATGFTPTTGHPWYDSTHEANVRARAYYEYDPGGRILDVYHWWDTYSSGSYTSTAILGNSCAYEYTGSKRGLKTGSSFWTNSSGSFVDAWDETYGYDANLDFLTSFTTGDGQSNASQSWSYDAAGNRASDYTGSSWAYDNLNRMTSNGAGTSYSNDILGNRTAFGSSTSYAWDCENRMTGYNGGTAYSYAYRADGMRVTKTAGSNTDLYRYDGQMPIEDVTTIGTAETIENGLGARGIDYSAVTSSGTTSVYFPIYDAHGNQVATLARSGSSYSIANQRDFDPWGNIRGGATTGDPKGRYCASLGHKQDDESNLVYMRARYYEPSSGRFISEDTDRSGMNWAVYASDNPVTNSDVNGKLTTTSLLCYLLGIISIIIPFIFTSANPIACAVFAAAVCTIGLYNDAQMDKKLAMLEKKLGIYEEASNQQTEALLKELTGEEKALSSPEEEAAEDSAAGPAILGLMYDVGQLQGELFADQADEESDDFQ